MQRMRRSGCTGSALEMMVIEISRMFERELVNCYCSLWSMHGAKVARADRCN